MTESSSRRILLGHITSVHGIRGEVKLRSFTSVPEDITAYGPLQDASGKIIEIALVGGTKDSLIAKVKGVTNRNDAERLRNTELFVPRSALPPARENEYYHEDLIGIALLDDAGGRYGSITGIHNFGAGDLVSIRRESGAEEFQPFTRAIFPKIEFDKGQCVIHPPEIIADE